LSVKLTAMNCDYFIRF